MHIEGNDLPGGEFDYDLRVKRDGVNPKYKSPKTRTIHKEPATKRWKAFCVFAFGAICFGCGVSVGSGDPQERAYEAPRDTITASPVPVIVTETKAVPIVPESCMLAYEKLNAMQGDLEIVIDSSKTQIQIGNRAYVAIVSKRVEDITKSTADQYELNRKTSSASLNLQNRLVELQSFLNRCKTDLGR